jgi:hypothetical protein
MTAQEAISIIGSAMKYLRLMVPESGEDNGETCPVLELERVAEWLDGGMSP